VAEVMRRRGESNALSFAPGDEVALEDALAAPDDGLAKALEARPGDFTVLGARRKMGPTLSRMPRPALNAARRNTDRVIAVSRWTDESARASLESFGVHTIRADLADRDSLASLPDAPNVVFRAGQKFGTHSDPGGTWLLNAVVPYRCAEIGRAHV